MSRVQMTNFDLHQLEANMQKLCADYPAFAFLNKEKIKNFYQRNGMSFKIMEERKAEFVKKYCIHGDDEKPVLEKKDDGLDHYTFQNETTQQEYIDKVTEFNNRSIFVEL